ncbi:MAG TPA: hypothetical protein VHQ03_04480 [Candidatus Dormibacteraeota bacterium]|jgi:uncharacterized membrane protein|nr:hypothetical protein [Candidatus Dormibacteraeota bacterium]
MSDLPPPPPSSQPAPASQPGAGGSNKNLYSVLAWALFPPIGSLIFLFVGKDDPDIKYNSAQAVVVHGGAFAVWIILRILTAIIVPIVFLLILWDVVWFVIWLVGVVVAFQAGGSRVNFPVLGPMAQQYIPTVEGWAK